MSEKRQVEIFSAGCSICEETIELVNEVACPSCEISVLDMQDTSVSDRARNLGIKSIPAILIDGKVADCCAGRGVDADTLRAAGIGQPLGT